MAIYVPLNNYGIQVNNLKVITSLNFPSTSSNFTKGDGTFAALVSGDIITALGYTPQTNLISGTNIKTINGTSLLGSGDITISGGGGSYTASAPLSISGSNILITQSNTSTDGYLSSTDWNTFNNKVNSLANPSGTIGLTSNNGTSTSAMRADATPALSQAIIPTWTGAHTFQATITSFNITPAADNLYGLGTASTRFGAAYIAVTQTGNLKFGATNLTVTSNGGTVVGTWYGATGNLVSQQGGTFTDTGYRADFITSGTNGYFRAGSLSVNSSNIPLAPTATAGTSTTQIATTAFTTTAITNLLAATNTWTGGLNTFNNGLRSNGQTDIYGSVTIRTDHTLAFYNTAGTGTLTLGTTPTGTNTQTYQDKSGTIALTSDLVAPVVDVVNTTVVNITSGTKYYSNHAGLSTLLLPTTAVKGSQILVRSNAGSGGWKITQNSGQKIRGATNSTVGTGGSLASQTDADVVVLECSIANTEWIIVSNRGTLTIV